jgi:hypothetical protein
LLRVLHRFNGLPVCSQTHPGCDLTQMAVWISEEIFSAYSLLLFLRGGSQESKYPRMRLVPLNLWIEGGRIGTEVEQDLWEEMPPWQNLRTARKRRAPLPVTGPVVKGDARDGRTSPWEKIPGPLHVLYSIRRGRGFFHRYQGVNLLRQFCEHVDSFPMKVLLKEPFRQFDGHFCLNAPVDLSYGSQESVTKDCFAKNRPPLPDHTARE